MKQDYETLVSLRIGKPIRTQGGWYRFDDVLYQGKIIGQILVKRQKKRTEVITKYKDEGVIGRDVQWLLRKYFNDQSLLVEFWHIIQEDDGTWYVLLGSTSAKETGGQIMKKGFVSADEAEQWIRSFVDKPQILRHPLSVHIQPEKRFMSEKRESKDNPSKSRLIHRHTEFNFRPPKRVRMMNIPIDEKILQEGVFEIGKVPHVSYVSKKEGKLVEYVHKFKIPVKMFCTMNNGILILVREDGKPFDIRDWIYG